MLLSATQRWKTASSAVVHMNVDLLLLRMFNGLAMVAKSSQKFCNNLNTPGRISLPECIGSLPFIDSRYLVWVSGNIMLADHVAKIVSLSLE